MGPLQIDFLYWSECESHPAALKRLEEVLAEEGLESDVVVKMLEVRSEEEAERLQFPGSPTIRVGGSDIDSEGAGPPFRLTCRTYRDPISGRLGPLPAKETIRRALLEKRSQRSAGK